ncbi:sodium:solute symporter [Pelagicoccus enzymogenes]|uniref:sodium:solute symporter n=1 Tax=Pelagicoccus enzymogenes TaxID=2773457 RepID=UPI00280D203D|nr:sodium:solute symporter [Pelagicoccus enzymogenes]MDQ8199394.1 sodium:solute symporter [Pelagicoccus enzymogenes]
MEGSFELLDWLFLIAYFAGTMGIAAFFYRRTRSEEGYTVGGRSLPGWVCGLSIFATFLSSISYLALPGKTFAGNWNPFVFSLSIPLVAIVAVRYFVPYYRSSREVSAYALLETRFGLWARVYASVFYLLTQVARIGVVLYLMALPMQVIFGWNIYTVLMVTGICVTVYSFIGGIVAVIWTDAIQAIVLMAGAVLCLGFMLFEVPGGVSSVVQSAGDAGKFSLGDFGLSFNAPTFWVVLVYGIMINLQNFGIDQSYVQRYLASSSAREARRSLWLGALLYVPVSALFFFIGSTLWVVYQDKDGSVPELSAVSELDSVKHIVARQKLLQQGFDLGDPATQVRETELVGTLQSGDIGDRVFPHFISTRLPPGVKGLLIAAIFAAAMSTVSTSLNSSATLIMSDFFKRFFKPAQGARSTMFVLYGSTILWGVLGTGLALFLVRLTESALDIWWTLSGILGGGMSGLFLLGMISRRAGNRAAIAGVTLGVGIIFLFSVPKLFSVFLSLPKANLLRQFAESFEGSYDGLGRLFHAYMIPVLGTLAILLVGTILSRVRIFSRKSSAGV